MSPRSRESIAPLEYDDFFLHLATGRNGYAVHAWSSRGEGTEPFVPPELDGKEPPERAGERLFEALFTGKVLRLLERTLARLEPGSGLRLKLMIDPLDPELGRLQALPWELMRQPGAPDFLALSRFRSIVRHLWIDRSVSACPRPERLRVLVVAACPRGREPLEVEDEVRNLRETLGPVRDIEIVEPIPSTLAGVRQALLTQGCHVLHFIGHGGFSESTGEGFLAFETDEGREDPVSGTDLVNKLAGFPTLRLVLLNACRSVHVASSLVLGGLPAAIAMREPVYDNSAIAFSRAFYGRLAAGDPVDAAVAEGRQAIPLAGAEWAIPALFMRTPEGELFPEEEFHPPEPVPWRRFAKWLIVAALVALVVFGIWLGCLWWLVAEGTTLLGDDPEKARERFETALALAPGVAEIHSSLGSAEEELRNDQAAEAHYREAVRLRPGDPVHLFNLGEFLSRRGQFQEAYRFLSDSVANAGEDPVRAEALLELARAAIGLDLLVEARRHLDAASGIGADTAPLHRLLGEAALRGGKAGEAVGHLQAALDRYPIGAQGRIETLSLLAAANDRLGDSRAACRAVAKFQHEDEAGISEWAPAVDEIAGRRSCPDP